MLIESYDKSNKKFKENHKYIIPHYVKLVKKYGLDDLTFHELRHTSATYLINKGMNPKSVSERLGHSDTSVTMEIYSHTFEHTKKGMHKCF